MEDRSFDEVDLRLMLDAARALRHDVVEGRFLVETTCGRRSWEVIVEPDSDTRLLVVVTAYPVREA